MRRILIVDDDTSVRGVLKLILERAGYHVTTMGSGADALNAMRAGAPDLLLLDIEMPGMSGFDVCMLIQNDPALRKIPVAMMTGRPIDGVPERVCAVGAVDLIAKPFDRQTLLQKVERYLRSTPQQA